MWDYIEVVLKCYRLDSQPYRPNLTFDRARCDPNAILSGYIRALRGSIEVVLYLYKLVSQPYRPPLTFDRAQCEWIRFDRDL